MQAARDSSEWGFGAASVRFICGTQGIHKTLEQRMSGFLGMEDTILYAACFDANTGLFETILGPEDAVISDELNHASIIDGVRLCKASRYRYRNNDMVDLEAKLVEARDAGARRILITTDGVFSMDGTIAQLDVICDLADQYGAMIHHDDCHATGFMGEEGRGVPSTGGYGSGRHHHRHLRQSAGRWIRWVHFGASGDHRYSPPTVSPLPVF